MSTRKSNIRLALSKLRPTGLLALLRNVWAKMTENAALFTTPPVTMATMGTKVDALALAIENATRGSATDREHRDALVLDAQSILRQQADYVRMVSQGDPDKLVKSGYELSRQPQPVGIPGTSRTIVARMTGRSGEVELRFGAVYGADSYQIWMTDKDPAINANWEAVGVAITKTRHLVDGLESFKAYWFCVSAIGAAGEGAKSDACLGRAA